jgi:FkbM family methyltransferase
MNYMPVILRHMPAPLQIMVRSWISRLSPKRQLWNLLAPIMPDTVCVDVGASYYAHPAWAFFRVSPNIRWIAVEPNEQNLGYTRPWTHPSELRICNTGLSQFGGAQTLYVTNVDSGSSLLEPVIPESQKHRFTTLDYFFPLRPRTIETITLLQVIPEQWRNMPTLVKLDTQGTELSILKGAHDLLAKHKVVGVELEATMLAQPLMSGGGKFWQANGYLEELGYELLRIKPIEGSSCFGFAKSKGYRYLNECDAVFAVRPDVAASLTLEHRLALLGLYVAYELHEEAYSLIVRDTVLASRLSAGGCSVPTVQKLLRKLA